MRRLATLSPTNLAQEAAERLSADAASQGADPLPTSPLASDLRVTLIGFVGSGALRLELEAPRELPGDVLILCLSADLEAEGVILEEQTTS